VFRTGEITKKEYYGVCAACNGSGYGRVPLASLADACGVSAQQRRVLRLLLQVAALVLTRAG